MMASRRKVRATQRLFHGMLQRNRDTTAEARIELAAMATGIGAKSAAADLLHQAAGLTATEDPARRLMQVLLQSEDGSLQRDLSGKLDALHLPQGSLLTLVPLSARYVDLWQLWLPQVQTHVGGSVVAMAMDSAALELLTGTPGVCPVDVRDSFSWSAEGRLHPHTRGVLWYLRTVVLRQLVERGHTVLVLDLDAVPVGDVQPLLHSLREADVIAQQDHSIPMDVDRELGFVLCCGFMLWRPSAGSLATLERLETETARERDDQLALNHLLSRQGIRQGTRDEVAMRFFSEGTTFACPDAALVSRSLHTGSVARHFHQTGQTVAELEAALGLPPV